MRITLMARTLRVKRHVLKCAVLALLPLCTSVACDGGEIITNAMPLEVSAFDTGIALDTSVAANVLTTTLTICDANSNCQTIDHIQVDTGSAGLRIFKGALKTVDLAQIVDNQGKALAVCQTFAAKGSAWGPVQAASVKLASEPAILIPVQVIDATFGAQPRPSPCDGQVLPAEYPANGILGIEGIGRGDSGVYFTCQANACTEFTPSDPQRVANPVLALPVDNNGVIINLPAISDNGQATAYGTLVLGIGTTWDNDPNTYSANLVVTVKLNTNFPLSATTITRTSESLGNTGIQTPVFRWFTQFALDTGSNAYFFTDPNIKRCPQSSGEKILNVEDPWYCPATPTNFAVAVGAISGSAWHFQVWIRDKTALTDKTDSLAFNDLGSDLGIQDTFIAGLPFFYGKQVYLGYAKKSSSLGDGPLYGYALH